MNTRAINIHANVELQLPGWRAMFALVLLLGSMLLLAGRAFYLQGWHDDFLQRQGEQRYSRVIDIPATRGMLTDRNDQPLAVSTPVQSVWAGGDVDINNVQLRKLAQALEVDPSEIRAKLNTQKDFVYLRRQLPPEQAQRVKALDIPGISLQQEYRRYYPAGDSVAQLVGLVNIDGKGQEGIELALNDQLGGMAGSERVLKDLHNRIVEDVASIRAPKPGHDVALSINAGIQYLAYRELKQAVIAHHARAGSIVVLDVNSGEVLAMANLPSCNPNNRGDVDPQCTRNRAVTDLFEPGSTLKPFTIATALESGRYRPDTEIQTAPGKMTIGNRTIHDAEPEGLLTVAQVIQKSSNVGASKIALTLPPKSMWDTFNAVGFGAAPRIEFPGVAGGELHAYQHWRPIEQATLSYGHGISVSLLQLARAYLVFATDGSIKPVTLIRQEGAPPQETRVFDANVAHEVRQMLGMVVEAGGTAPQAQITGYTVAGKTGTAHKLVGARYAPDKYVASFVGFAPASAPRVIVAVMVDEPSPDNYYGGSVAGPVFSKVMAGTLRTLGVPPDAPDHVAPGDNVPQVKEGV